MLKVTPLKFRTALHEVIFPSLDVALVEGKTVCERTTCRWLYRLGFSPHETKKGVYVDGHERADVVEYRQTKFLPLMLEYDR
jgi:hypothetical protein